MPCSTCRTCFDEQGLPAIQSPDLNMSSLLKRQVQIVARSLCPATEKTALLDLQRKSECAGAPLLQAIVVCLRPNTSGPLPYRTFPRPTVLALAPEDIGGGPAAFFLCPTLQHKMDFKVRLYITKLNMENLASFRNTVKPIDNEDVALDKLESLKQRMKAVDINNTRKLVYGEFPKDAVPLTQVFGRLPMGHIQQLVHMAGRPIFLYCKGLAAQAGVVELMVPHPTLGTVRTYGVFQLAHYRFFFPPDCFGRDLANIMPLPAKETFAVCAKLAWPESKIPYVVTHIWNENLRRELGRPPPTGPINENEVLTTCAETAAEILGQKKPPKVQQAPIKATSTNTSTSTSNLVPVPAKVMVFNSQVKTFDKNRIHIENGEIVANFNNIVGDVESVLSDHHAIVKFRPLKSSKEYRVLCHSDDVFNLDFPEAKNQNPHKFSAAWDLWKESAKMKKLSLTGIMRPKAKVRLNAALLLSNGPNPAEVHYVSAGVLVGKNSLSHTVPVECFNLPNAEYTYPFKLHVQKVVKALDKNGNFVPALFEGPLKPTTDDLPKIAKTWKKGPKGFGMIVRPEYQQGATTAATSATKTPEPEKKKPESEKPKPETSTSLPNPVKSQRSKAPLIQNAFGRVIKIINENYGIAVGKDPNGGGCFQMLFDSFDVFLGNISCKEMGKKLSDLIKVGDHIKYCAILIAPNTPLTRDISHLATAVVFASTHSLIRTRDIPSTAPKVTNLKQLEAAKVSNFRTVTGLVGKTALTEREKQLMAEVDVGGKGKDDMEIDSDDEVEVLPTAATKVDEVELKAANAQLEARIKDFNLKDLRKLLMTYMTYLASAKETTERKIDLTKISEGVNKDLGTVERLFLALGRKVKVEPKGQKVGQVFLSQQQVKNVLDKGILAPEHVDRTAQEAAEAAKKAAAEKHAAARKEAAEKAAAIRKAAEEAKRAALEKAATERAAALKAKEEKLAAEKAAAEKAAAEKAAAEAGRAADPL